MIIRYLSACDASHGAKAVCRPLRALLTLPVDEARRRRPRPRARREAKWRRRVGQDEIERVAGTSRDVDRNPRIAARGSAHVATVQGPRNRTGTRRTAGRARGPRW